MSLFHKLQAAAEHDCIMKLQSIGEHTHGEYPHWGEYLRARSEGRVSSKNWKKKVTIAGNTPSDAYTFVAYRRGF